MTRIFAALAGLAFGLAGCGIGSGAPQIRVDDAESPVSPYDRAAFGRPWTDVDGNGCDTRNDILQRDLVATVIAEDQCRVLEGVLTDPYTGATVTFVRGTTTSRAVQIDHVYALRDAWDDGAAEWSPGKRLAFANDPRNLVAASGSVNASKGDDGPVRWTPRVDEEKRCDYVSAYLLVGIEYDLDLDAGVADVAQTCGLDELLRQT